MCRNIKTLANFAPPATEGEIRASALQFVRKLSGANRPSRANEAAFNRAIDEVTAAAHRLIHSLTTSAPPRNRDEELRKARERAHIRNLGLFGQHNAIGDTHARVLDLPAELVRDFGGLRARYNIDRRQRKNQRQRDIG